MPVKRFLPVLALFLAGGLPQILLAQQVFKSGFENNTTIGPDNGFGGSGFFQSVTGTDTSTGYTWPLNLWGAQQMGIHLDPEDGYTDADTSHFLNEIVTMTGHTGASTKALHMKIFGYDNNSCCAQDVLEANTFSTPIHDEYFRIWVNISSQLLTNFAANSNDFEVLWEWKTLNNTRVGTNINNSGGTPYWSFQTDDLGRSMACQYEDPNTGATYSGCSTYVNLWQIYGRQKSLPVPIGQWFLLEVWQHRSIGQDGRYAYAVNGTLVYDYRGPNYGLGNEEVTNSYYMNMYGAQFPKEWWLDDIEVRDSLPPGCSAFPCGVNETGSPVTAPVPPYMTSPRGAIGVVGKSFTYQITGATVSGSIAKYEATSGLPPGLSLDQTTGLISGTPAAAGRYFYFLQLDNNVGDISNYTVIFEINNPATSPPTISSFTATPSSISAGQWSQLNWAQSGADTLTINQGIGNVNGMDPLPVNPGSTTTYTLTACNGAGCVNASTTVTVNGTVNLPTISSFTATPSSISSGQLSTLAWTITGATSVSINQGIGAVTGSSISVSPTATTVYTITATNQAGSVTANAAVTVGSLPTISSFTASPSTITPGSTGTLSWSTSGATSLSIDQSVGTVTGLTSIGVSPLATTTYTLTATNNTGSVSRSATVNVSTTTQSKARAALILQ